MKLFAAIVLTVWCFTTSVAQFCTEKTCCDTCCDLLSNVPGVALSVTSCKNGCSQPSTQCANSCEVGLHFVTEKIVTRGGTFCCSVSDNSGVLLDSQEECNALIIVDTPEPTVTPSTDPPTPEVTNAPTPEVTNAPPPEVTNAPTPKSTPAPATDPVDPSGGNTDPKSDDGNDLIVYIGIAAGGFVFVAFVALMFLSRRKPKNTRKTKSPPPAVKSQFKDRSPQMEITPSQTGSEPKGNEFPKEIESGASEEPEKTLDDFIIKDPNQGNLASVPNTPASMEPRGSGRMSQGYLSFITQNPFRISIFRPSSEFIDKQKAKKTLQEGKKAEKAAPKPPKVASKVEDLRYQDL